MLYIITVFICDLFVSRDDPLMIEAEGEVRRL